MSDSEVEYPIRIRGESERDYDRRLQDYYRLSRQAYYRRQRAQSDSYIRAVRRGWVGDYMRGRPHRLDFSSRRAYLQAVNDYREGLRFVSDLSRGSRLRRAMNMFRNSVRGIRFRRAQLLRRGY